MLTLLHRRAAVAMRLARLVDRLYDQGAFSQAEALDGLVDAELAALDQLLWNHDEDADPLEDFEPEPFGELLDEGCSIEEQFVGAYASHLRNPVLCTREDVLVRLRGVLLDAAHSGPMGPTAHRPPSDDRILEVAAALYSDRQAFLHQLRSHARATCAGTPVLSVSSSPPRSGLLPVA